MDFGEAQLQQLRKDLSYRPDEFQEEETAPWLYQNLGTQNLPTQTEDEASENEEEHFMDGADHDEHGPSDDEDLGNQVFYECGNPFGIRQMASVLLGDTSESDNDQDESHELGSHIDINGITEEMYKAIKNQIIEQKSKNSSDLFIADWRQQQEDMYFKWQEKQESRREMVAQRQEDKVEDKSTDDADGIPKVTILEAEPKYSKKQIEERMAKMDPAKRERWENWYVQCELSKTKKQTMLKSDVRKDYKRLIEGNGHERLVQHYKTELANLKENVKTSVEKMERIIAQLEEKEPKSHSESKKFEEEAEADMTGQESDSSEASGVSEEREPLTEQEIFEFEEKMCQKILIPPNEEKILELLNMEIVYPEKPPETVKLGRSINEVEETLLESKGLKNYITRVVYFFHYKSEKDASFVRSEYDRIVKDIVAAESRTNKGCLLVYENVHIAIVMVEGEEFEILKHLSKFQRAELYGSVKCGKVLYVHQFLVKTYFNKWVVRVESPPPGKIKYLTRTKKVVYRTAASRVARVSEMLHKVYRHVSKEEKYLIDPRSIYTKSKYIILLPSPALFAYLVKYSVLRDLKAYLEDLGKPWDIESEDEQLFAFTEDFVYSNYVDTDSDEEVKKTKLNYAKAVVEEGGVEHRRRIKEMDDLRVKDTGEVITWDEFHLDEIGATVVDGRVKTTDDPDHPAVRLGAAIEARQAKTSDRKEKQAMMEPEQAGEFLTFIEKGSDRWQRKLKTYSLHLGRSVSKTGRADSKSRESASKDERPEIAVTQAEELSREMLSESDSSEMEDLDTGDNTSESSNDSDEAMNTPEV